MKNFLRKLHIGDSAAGGASSPAAPPPPPSKKGGGGFEEHKHASGISGWLSSVAWRPSPPPPLPAPRPAAAAPPPPAAMAEKTALAIALASSVEERRVVEEENRVRRETQKEEAEEERKREEKKEQQKAELEEYHMQLALEMSVREDPEAMQIEVAKQISLGSCPLQSSPAEVVAFRYWVLSLSIVSSRSIYLLDCLLIAVGSHSRNVYGLNV
jgi:hypothetical protein